MRRVLKILGISVLVILLILILTPFLFKGKLEDILKRTLNERLDATVNWEQLDLSLLKSFPDAALTITEFSVINKGTFAGDTLAYGDQLELDMGITQLFKNSKDDPIQVNTVILEGAIINIKINAAGVTNYEITKNTKREGKDITEQKETSGFAFALQHYELRDATINYLDESSKTFLRMRELNHEGNGDFSAARSTLSTTTTAKVSFDFDQTNYLNNNSIQLIADVGMDLEAQRYTFLENEVLINALPLSFEGYVQEEAKGTRVDLRFETLESDFKNFLAVIPSTYTQNLDEVKTQGDFRVSGIIKGLSTRRLIPTMDISMTSTNASFNYPSLPKQMENINIDVKLKNDTGLADDTYIAINALSFRIDDDLFTANGILRNLAANMLVNLALQGTLDLGKLTKVYPLGLENPLSGILTMDMRTGFDMNAINGHQYDRIQSTGTATLTDLNYTSDKLPKPLIIDQATLDLTPSRIVLNSFSGRSGTSDIEASGTIENLIPFLMSKEDLKGHFVARSEVFDLHDFTIVEVENSTGTKTNEQQKGTKHREDAGVKIPDFLDASMDFEAQQVIYDDLTLKNVSGGIRIQDEEAQLRDVTSELFGGRAGINGTVATGIGTPTFDVALDLSNIDIASSFEQLDLLKGLAPIAAAIQGVVNTRINLQGDLDQDFSPILSTIAGDAFAQLLTATVDPKKTPLLNTLDNQLEFVDLSKIDLSQLQTNLQFENGAVQVSPITFTVEDIAIAVQGGHRFDQQLNYSVNLDIPATAMGDDVSRLLASLSSENREDLTVNIPVSLSGNFKKPIVQVDTKAALNGLTQTIIKKQQQQTIDKVDESLGGILDGILGKDSTPKDSSNTQEGDLIRDTTNDLLNGILGKKKKNDSIPKGSNE